MGECQQTRHGIFIVAAGPNLHPTDCSKMEIFPGSSKMQTTVTTVIDHNHTQNTNKLPKS